MPPTPEVTVQAVGLNGLLTSRIPAVNFHRKLTRIRIDGPAGSACTVYNGAISPSNRIDNTPYGAQNVAEYISPHFVSRGAELFVVWSVGTGTASATCFFEAA